MTVATTKKTDVLEELAALERKEREAAEEEDAASRESAATSKRLHELVAARDDRYHLEPTEYNADLSPRRKDSEAGRIQAEIEAGTDTGELDRVLEHKRQVHRRERERKEAFILEHYAEIRERGIAEDQRFADDVNAAAAALVEALRRYIGRHGANTQLTIPIREIDGRHVPGLEAAGNFLRAVESINLPAPTPKLPHE
jgi:hypothetical protein